MVWAFDQFPQCWIPQLGNNTPHVWEITKRIGFCHDSVDDSRSGGFRVQGKKAVRGLEVVDSLVTPNDFHKPYFLLRRSRNSAVVMP